MNRVMALALFAALVVGGTAIAARGQQAPQKQAQRPIDNLAWLVGGVWTADTSRPESGRGRIETRYQWSDNGAFIRFNTHFISQKGTLKNYDGQFFWDGEHGELAMWYTDARNEITHGPVKIDANVIEMNFHGEDFDGKPADFRVRVTRKTNDDYNWLLEEKVPDGWKLLLTLEYLRTAGS